MSCEYTYSNSDEKADGCRKLESCVGWSDFLESSILKSVFYQNI
jgi:hypothetical protein